MSETSYKRVASTDALRLVTVAGPPAVGKTAILTKALPQLVSKGWRVGVVKLDCVVADEQQAYERVGVCATVCLAGPLCPDHYFACNIERCIQWGRDRGLDLLVTESAGLCGRCSPYIKGVLAVCVVDVLSGLHAPTKIGPMLKLADIVLVTKGDIVSQAEREVFAHRVQQVASRAGVLFVNGLSGQGADEVARVFESKSASVGSVTGMRLRFSMPAALCSYCLGETRLGDEQRIGNLRVMEPR